MGWYRMNMIEQDKANHALVGVGITAVSTLLLGPWWALLPCAVAAASKELYDLQHREAHTPDWRDFVWTVAGGALVALSHLSL
jgi:hypothetical protein